MPSIVTLTFNPCIDKNTSIPSLVPEKKLRCAPPVFEPGGGGINISRVLHSLGVESLAIFPSGGYTGQFLLSLMEKENLKYNTVETATYTRENLIVYEETSGQQFRFGMPGSPVTEKEVKALLDKVEQTPCDFVVASGSLMPGMSTDIVGQVARLAKRKGARLVIDTSGDALKKALDVGVFLLKPNLAELSSLVGKDEVTYETVDQIAKDIISKGQCEVIVVSLGAKGARMITKNEVYAVASPVVKSVSTLGAGDSMVAGMVLKLSQNRPLKEVLQFGVACGTAATLTEGSELIRKKDVDRLYNIISTSS